MRGRAVCAGLMLSMLAIVPEPAQAQVSASGRVSNVYDIKGVVVGDQVEINFTVNGWAVFLNRTRNTSAYCNKGLTDGAPATQISRCKMLFSDIPGISTVDVLDAHIYFGPGGFEDELVIVRCPRGGSICPPYARVKLSSLSSR